MDLLQEIYFMWDEKNALGKRELNRELVKKDRELEKLKKDLKQKMQDDNTTKEELNKIFNDVIDAEKRVSFEEQNMYFVEGFKQGVKFLLSCLD